MTDLKIETVSIASLTPDPVNARKHDARNLQAIENSLLKFGQRKPICVTPDSIVVAGNGTLEAAKNLGWTEIAIARTPVGWSWEQIRAFALADNRTAELAEWDDKVLADQLLELDANGWELEELGFENLEPPVGQDDDDEPLSFDDAPTRSKLGDLWQIGEHRILCGDSLDLNNLNRLTAGLNVKCILTDPPYGINLETDYTKMGSGVVKPNNYKKVANDDRPFDAGLIRDYFKEVTEQFWFGANYYWRTLSDFDLQGSWLVWDKRNDKSDVGLGSGFELCWSSNKHKQDLLRYLWTGFTARERDEKRVHPTQKPIAMLSEILDRWAEPNCVVIDMFAGSGATLVAASKTNRIAIGIELDPYYVDVILSRLEKQTGLEAQLIED
jgi:DNA modification methylase